MTAALHELLNSNVSPVQGLQGCDGSQAVNGGLGCASAAGQPSPQLERFLVLLGVAAESLSG